MNSGCRLNLAACLPDDCDQLWKNEENEMDEPAKALFELDLQSDAKDSQDEALELLEEGIQVEETDGFSVAADKKKCYEMVVLSAKVWPEVKTEYPIKCVLSVFGKCRIKTKVPVAYKRISRLELVVRVCVPTEDDIKDAIEECIKGAVLAGVITSLSAGTVAATATALKVYLQGCLVAKGIKAEDDISVDASIRKKPGRWSRV